jgi:CspA family cold shock protein
VNYQKCINFLGGVKMEERTSGVVKWFSNEKGYGFILKDGDQDVECFVHYSSILMDGYKTLKAGQKVTFQLKELDKDGKIVVQAINVVVEA